jgi:hypothetical protein
MTCFKRKPVLQGFSLLARLICFPLVFVLSRETLYIHRGLSVLKSPNIQAIAEEQRITVHILMY